MHLLRFALVGSAAAFVYLVGYIGLMALGLTQIIANALAFLSAVTTQYVGHTLFTFRAPLRDRAQAIRFIAMILCGLVTAALITGTAAAALDLPDWLAALTVTLVLPVQNYAFMILWVFTKSDEKQQVLS